MADQSFSQQQSQQQSNQQDSAAQNIAQTQENAAVLAQLNTTEELPRVDLDSAKDGPSFGRMAATILDAIVPGEGSFASMKITGTIPLYETGVMSVQLRPSLAIEASRNLGKIKVKIGTDFTLRAQLDGSEGWRPNISCLFSGISMVHWQKGMMVRRSSLLLTSDDFGRLRCSGCLTSIRDAIVTTS